jgi:hypothetical protein
LRVKLNKGKVLKTKKSPAHIHLFFLFWANGTKAEELEDRLNDLEKREKDVKEREKQVKRGGDVEKISTGWANVTLNEKPAVIKLNVCMYKIPD